MTHSKKTSNKPRKTYNVCAKPMHYKVVQNLVENGGNKYKAIRDAGYSEAVATTPQKVTESKGFKQAMQELGLTDTLLVTSLVSDIKTKENRFNELQLGFKLRGHLKDTVQESKTLILITSGESAKRYDVVPTDTPHVLDVD
jgi:hypothetical protein